MTGASTTISTSSAQSRENARQPATSAWLSNVPVLVAGGWRRPPCIVPARPAAPDAPPSGPRSGRRTARTARSWQTRRRNRCTGCVHGAERSASGSRRSSARPKLRAPGCRRSRRNGRHRRPRAPRTCRRSLRPAEPPSCHARWRAARYDKIGKRCCPGRADARRIGYMCRRHASRGRGASPCCARGGDAPSGCGQDFLLI